MKKFTLIAIAAFAAVSANAQFNCDPTTADVVAKNPSAVYPIVLSDAGLADLTKGGAKVVELGPNDDTRNLWVWDNTFVGGDGSYPRVDMEEGGYVAFEVGTVGWSGAGFNISGDGADLSAFGDNTHFHLAYMTPTGNAPVSLVLVILDGGDHGSNPAKIAVGTAYDDNGVIYPTVGAALTDDWQGIDLTLADLKKLFPTFNMADKGAWTGNVLSFLAGGVAGKSFAMDAIYFYNLGEDGVEGVAAENAEFVVTRNTVNVMGANGIELYNLAGQLVKSTNGTTLGLTNLANGVYVAKAGNKVQKVVVR